MLVWEPSSSFTPSGSIVLEFGEKKTAVMGFLMSLTEVFLVSYYYGNRMVNLIVVL